MLGKLCLGPSHPWSQGTYHFEWYHLGRGRKELLGRQFWRSLESYRNSLAEHPLTLTFLVLKKRSFRHCNWSVSSVSSCLASTSNRFSVEHYSWEKSGILQIQRWQAMLANYFWVICLETNSYCFFGLVFVWNLGGGNSNIFYFHPDPWRNDPNCRAYFFKWVIQPPGRKPIFFTVLERRAPSWS